MNLYFSGRNVAVLFQNEGGLNMWRQKMSKDSTVNSCTALLNPALAHMSKKYFSIFVGEQRELGPSNLVLVASHVMRRVADV